MITEIYKNFKEGMEEFGKQIAMVVNTIFLSCVYFLGVGIISLGSKIIRKNFLDTTFDKTKDSYWEDLDHKKISLESYYKQF